MKFLSKVLFSMGLIGFALTGCERHEFEKTKALHLEHGKGHGEAHGEGHAVEADHAKEGAAHAKEAPAAPAPAAPAPAPAPAAPAPAAPAPAPADQPRATGL